MKKKEQGILTVEASIVLTVCTLFILFLLGFARVYRAQSLVSHAVLQSSDSIALESYLRETALFGSESDVVELANRLTGSTSISADSFTSLRSADLPKIAREKFIYAIADSEAKADEKLKQLGVKDGLDGVDFSASKMDLGNDDIIVFAQYIIETQFPVLGLSEIEVTKAAKSKSFGDILFEIQTIPKEPHTGSASGGGNYKHGTQIQISATPNYGYKFLKWEDGNTDNPRTVTVNGPKTYVAVFVEDQFGINTNVSPRNSGTVSGGGTYNYLSTQTVTANSDTGYHFTKWSIYKHKDRTTSIINDSSSYTVTVDQSYTCTAYFEPNNYTVTAKCSGGPSDSYAKVIVNSGAQQSAPIPYKSSFKLTASSVAGYEFSGWKIEGTANYFSTSPTVNLTVPANNVTYVACYKLNPSISISVIGGGANNHYVKLQATTVPTTANVIWSTNSKAVNISVDSANSHIATVTVQDNNITTSKLDNNSSRSVESVITASIKSDGDRCSGSKTLKIIPTITVEYFCRRDGFCSYSNKQCGYGPSWWVDNRGARKINSQSVGMRFYYNSDPGPNEKDPYYGLHLPASTGVFHNKMYVTWSQICGAKKVGYKNMLTKSMIVHDTATTGPYAGVKNPQVGYNAVRTDAYILYDGNYDALWFVTDKKAPKDSNNYYDYYINAIY